MLKALSKFHLNIFTFLKRFTDLHICIYNWYPLWGISYWLAEMLYTSITKLIIHISHHCLDTSLWSIITPKSIQPIDRHRPFKNIEYFVIAGHRFSIIFCSFILLLFGCQYLEGARTWKQAKKENYILVSAGNNVMNSRVEVIGRLVWIIYYIITFFTRVFHFISCWLKRTIQTIYFLENVIRF